MKIPFIFITTLFLCSTSILKADETLIVNVGKTVEFGLWRVYNSGTEIYIVDKADMQYLQLNSTTNSPTFATQKNRLLLHDDGTAGEMSAVDSSHPYTQNAAKAISTPISGHLVAGRYAFGEKRLVVNDNTITIFNGKEENPVGVTIPNVVLKKYSNEIAHTGKTTSTYIEPTKVLIGNNAIDSAVVLGDCLATYNPTTGVVTIPCLKVNGDNTVYRLKQQQIPDTLKFEVDLNSIQRVQ